MSEIQLHEWRKMHCRTIHASIYMQVSMGIYWNSLPGKNFFENHRCKDRLMPKFIFCGPGFKLKLSTSESTERVFRHVRWFSFNSGHGPFLMTVPLSRFWFWSILVKDYFWLCPFLLTVQFWLRFISDYGPFIIMVNSWLWSIFVYVPVLKPTHFLLWPIFVDGEFLFMDPKLWSISGYALFLFYGPFLIRIHFY